MLQIIFLFQSEQAILKICKPCDESIEGYRTNNKSISRFTRFNIGSLWLKQEHFLEYITQFQETRLNEGREKVSGALIEQTNIQHLPSIIVKNLRENEDHVQYSAPKGLRGWQG